MLGASKLRTSYAGVGVQQHDMRVEPEGCMLYYCLRNRVAG